ncbi:hypothetical protein [Citrobacter arsenatis]|uniref:hypothetical protein n=1 Tax=Citrobacter arsenatis TaxID=2546350 RepID=UPI00300DD9BD
MVEIRDTTQGTTAQYVMIAGNKAGGGTYYDSAAIYQNAYTFSIKTSGDDQYTGGKYINVNVTGTHSITVSSPTPKMLTTVLSGGAHQYTQTKTVECTATPIQLTINSIRDLDYGLLKKPDVKFIGFNIQITSGTTIPMGTITFTSPETKTNGRINLGGGEVSIWDPFSKIEYPMGKAIPITDRITAFTSRLDSIGATPGPAEGRLTVTMTVN